MLCPPAGVALAYSIHIERYNDTGQRAPIEREEWIEAVNATNGVRLTGVDLTSVNPVTSENIVIQGHGPNAELRCEQDDAWFPVFRWNERGTVTFNASPDFDGAKSRLRTVAGELARKLNARLVGDEGEFYS